MYCIISEFNAYQNYAQRSDLPRLLLLQLLLKQSKINVTSSRIIILATELNCVCQILNLSLP